jgi:hypothetical protein
MGTGSGSGGGGAETSSWSDLKLRFVRTGRLMAPYVQKLDIKKKKMTEGRQWGSRSRNWIGGNGEGKEREGEDKNESERRGNVLILN